MPENQAPDSGQPTEPAAPKPKTPPVGPLSSLYRVRVEAGKLYRAARQGKLSASDASRLASVLGLVARLVESSDLEERLIRVERAIEDGHE